MNKIIKTFRKQTKPEKDKNGVLKPRTRPFTTFICYLCKEEITLMSSRFKPDKPCKNCLKRLRGKKNFLLKAKKKFGDKFDLTKAEAEYYDSVTPVTIHCNIHSVDYKVSPTNFVKAPRTNQPAKGSCPKCIQEVQRSKNRKPISHYLRLLSDKFPAVQVVEHGAAETNLEKIKLSCPVHGVFEKTLAAIVKSDPSVTNLCPKCSAERLAWNTRTARTDVTGKVYFVKFIDKSLYKCGVTYKTVKDRFKGHLSNIEEIWELEFDTLSDAYFFEYQFFREYKHLRCCHPDTSLGGYTEFLSSHIVKPNKRFVEEILRRKEPKTGNPDH